MLSAVSQESDRTEGLRDYISGVKRAPTFVPPVASRPRLATQPGEQVPGLSGNKPASSSQKPGFATNQVIPYSRVSFSDFAGSPLPTSDLLSGDIMFVYTSRNALGHNSNRASKVASWRQVNAALEEKIFRPKRSKVASSRQLQIDSILSATKSDTKEVEFFEKRRLNIDYLKKRRDGLKQEYESFLRVTQELKTGGSTYDLNPFTDWRAFDALQDWAVDGVLISKDDDEQNASAFHAGGGDSGVALNIAVQGPAALRNAPSQRLMDESELNSPSMQQLVDPSARIGDVVYLLLICNERLRADGKLEGFTFSYAPASMRLIRELSQHKSASSKAGYGSLTIQQLRRCVGATEIGKVMDSSLVSGSHAKLKINVNVRQLGLMELAETFDSNVFGVDVSEHQFND